MLVELVRIKGLPFILSLGNDGAAVTGWQDIDGKHLYFTDTGIYASKGIYSINGKKIFF